MTAWAVEPALTEGEIDALLTQYSITDADGNIPSSEDWTPTYNLRAAAREGWTWKMGRCTDLVSTDLDGDRMSSNQAFEHCKAMVAKYAGAASPQMTAASTETDVSESFFSD